MEKSMLGSRSLRLLVLVLACLLGACAPSMTSSPGAVAGDAAFTRSVGPKYDTLTFDPQKRPAFNAVAFLSGDVVRLNDARCTVVGTGVRCLLGDVQPDKVKLLFSTGVTSGRVEYGRGDGKLYVVTLK